MTDNEQTLNNNRRAALKALAAASGAVTIAALPKVWSKPSVAVGAIPAHAQASCGVGLSIELIFVGQGGTPVLSVWPDGEQPDGVLPDSTDPVWSTALCGCVLVILGNSGDDGPVSYEITIGTNAPIPQDYDSGELEAFAVNLATGALTSAPTAPEIDYGSISCPSPNFPT